MRNRNQLAGLIVFTAGMFALLLSPHATAQVVTSVAPTSAEVGEVVQLTGSGFDPVESYTIHLDGGVSSPAANIQTDSLTFVVPAGARSGGLTIETVGSGAMVSTARPLTVLRQVAAQIDPALAAATAGYEMGTIYGDVGAAALVPVGEPGFVAAAGPADDDPSLMGVTTENTTSLTLDAGSTAAALVFMTPLGLTGDPVEAESRITTLLGLPETQALAGLIDSSLTAGTEYLDDPSFDDLFVAAVDAFLAALPPASGSQQSASAGAGGGSPENGGGFEDDFIEQEVTWGFNSPHNLTHGSELPEKRTEADPVAGVTLDKNGLPQRSFKLRAAITPDTLLAENPIDWVVGYYELDPWYWKDGAYRFDGGNDSVLALTHTNEVFPRYYPGTPLGYTVVPQESFFNLFNVAALIRDLALGESVATPEQTLPIAADRPGLYIARAYSGSLWPAQDPLIDSLPDGDGMMISAIALNATIIALDYSAVLIPSEEVVSPKVVRDAVTAAVKASRTSVARAFAEGGMTYPLMMALIKDSGTALVGGLATGVAEQALSGGPVRFAKTTGKLALKSINLFDKFGNYANGSLRTAALFNKFGRLWTLGLGLAEHDPVAATVETTAIVMGDPWAPVITGFTPRSAHRGQVIRIEGRNFSYELSENLVEFDGPGGTISATPVAATETALDVAVPAGATPGATPINVTVTTLGSARTDVLAPPLDALTVLPDPVISGTLPVAPLVGGLITIQGSGFSVESGTNQVVLVGQGLNLSVVSASPTQIQAEGFFSVGLQDIQVQIVDPDGSVLSSSNVVSANVTLPPGANAPAGVNIWVNSLTDNTTADEFVTLREALHWARDGLAFRAPSQDESGLITGTLPPIMAGHADSIVFPGLSDGDVIVLNPALGPLPGVDSFDALFSFYDVTVDGGDLAGDGLILDAVADVHVEGLTWRNFGNHCVYLAATTDSTLLDVVADNCGVDGFRIEDGSSSNRFINIGSSNNDDDGIHLNGAGVLLNDFSFDFGISSRSAREISDNGGYGLHVDGGANRNRLHVGDLRLNDLGGIRIAGSTSTDNFVGTQARVAGGQMIMEITDNTGPGLHSDASRTSARYLRIGNSGGDGILFEGSAHTGSRISACSIGMDALGTATPNQGSGVHLRGFVSDTQIGEDYVIGFNVAPPNEIGGNTQHGIWLEGTGVHDVRVQNSRIGASMSVTWGVPPVAGNAIHGIAVTGGAHDNTLGHPNESIHLEIVGHANGAGIYLDGSTTTGNVIVGNQIGNVYRDLPWNSDWAVDATMANRYGVRITNQAWDNSVGLRGWWLETPYSFSSAYFDSSNYFFSNSEAGVLIESGGDPSQTFPPSGGVSPRGANLVQNNVFGHHSNTVARNQYGLILRGNAWANRIGGTNGAESNAFNGAVKASLWIDGVVTQNPLLSNRIIRNEFRSSLWHDAPVEPLETAADGVGLLITDSQNQVIGGNHANERNRFYDKPVGIHIANSQSIAIRNNIIGPAYSTGNHIAGLILTDSQSCTIGPGNQLIGNGNEDPAHARGGISILRGSGHVIEGNFLGTRPDAGTSGGNRPWGILIRDSAGNRIGGTGQQAGNVIVGSYGEGVVIESGGSTGNQVVNNWIGMRFSNQVPYGNQGAGVLLRDGATGNTIGGTTPVSLKATRVEMATGNVLHSNADGIVADGAATTGNRYLNNSITGHGGTGIQNLNGANGGLPGPTITSITNHMVIGTADPAVAPGSQVQIFSDPDDEGEVLVAQALTDGAGGFQAPLVARHEIQLRASVTDAVTGSSSELGPAFSLPAAIELALDPDVMPVTSADGGAEDVVAIPLLVRANELSAKVAEVNVQATGTLYDPAGVIALNLYEDFDGDGMVSTDDPLLGGPVTFASDDGSVAIPLSGGVLSAGESKRWLITINLASGATVGTTFGCEIVSAAAVTGQNAFTGTTIPASGVFPLQPGEMTIGAGPDLQLQPSLTVSDDTTDLPNFLDLQMAIDAVGTSGMTIRILPGLSGTYMENISIDVGAPVVLDGEGLVTIDGAAGVAVFVAPTSDPVSLQNLTLSGGTGLEAHAPTLLRDVIFDDITILGADLRDGAHRFTRTRFEPGTPDGIFLGPPASLDLDRSKLLQLTGPGLRVQGVARVESSLFAGGTTGLLVESGGFLDLVGSTVADGSAAGVERLTGGSVTIDTGLLWGNAMDDYVGGTCGDIAWSLTGSPDCSGSGGNLSVDPLFTAPGSDYRPALGSPAIDAGPPPELFGGSPCFDLDDGPRLRDADEDGLAHVDLGAFEFAPVPGTPGEVQNIAWADANTMTWSTEAAAIEYHVYRGALSGLSFADFGSCRDDLDADQADTSLSDSELPAPGEGWFYGITADDGVQEGMLGLGSCAERSRFAICP